MSSRRSGDSAAAPASNSRTSVMEACVPSMRDERTASWVDSGDNRTPELGMAWRMPS